METPGFLTSSAGDPDHVVVLRQPEAAVAEALYMFGQIERVAKRVGGRADFENEGEIEYG